jgi:hypothetical protein
MVVKSVKFSNRHIFLQNDFIKIYKKFELYFISHVCMAQSPSNRVPHESCVAHGVDGPLTSTKPNSYTMWNFLYISCNHFAKIYDDFKILQF